MRKKTMTAGFAALICMLALNSCKKEQPPMPTTAYKTLTVQTQNRELSTKYPATIRGRQDIDIYPQVSGTLQKLFVKEGERVKKGQTLFIIDQVPYQAALSTALANVKAAEAAVATAELNYKGRKELFDQKVVSEFDLQQAENSLLSAKASLEQAKAQKVNAANNLSYTEVKSPADGVIGILPYRQGALVSSNIPQPLTTVSDNSQMYVYFSMNETEMLEMTRQYGSPEAAIQQMPPVLLQLSDGTIYADSGRVESISGVIDPSTGTASWRAAFDNPNHLLHSGASGNIIIPAHYKDCVVIPQEATIELQDKVQVFKVVDGIAKGTIIEVSKINNGKEYIVTGGLKPGDVIVAEGAGVIREGTPVNGTPAQQASSKK